VKIGFVRLLVAMRTNEYILSFHFRPLSISFSVPPDKKKKKPPSRSPPSIPHYPDAHGGDDDGAGHERRAAPRPPSSHLPFPPETTTGDGGGREATPPPAAGVPTRVEPGCPFLSLILLVASWMPPPTGPAALLRPAKP